MARKAKKKKHSGPVGEATYERFLHFWNAGTHNGKVLATLMACSTKTVQNCRQRLRAENWEDHSKEDAVGPEIEGWEARCRELYDAPKFDGRGLSFRRNERNSLDIARIEFTADYDKRPARWAEAMERLLGERRFRKEQLIDYTVFSGHAVYPEFDVKRHVVDASMEPGIPVMRAWDFGLRRPCITWSQEFQGSWIILGCELGEDIGIDEWVKHALAQSLLLFPARYIDFCDASGKQRNESGRSSLDVLAGAGVYPQYRKLPVAHGIEIIKQKLRVTAHTGLPRCYIAKDGPGTEYLIAGFNGGYHFKRDKDNAALHEEPHKDGYYEHGMDCVRYNAHCMWDVRPYDLIEADVERELTADEIRMRDEAFIEQFQANMRKKCGEPSFADTFAEELARW